MADGTVSIIKEECFLDEILNELPNRVAKPTPTVKGNHLSVSKFFHQISDSLKDLHLVYTCLDTSSLVIALGTNVGNAFIYHRNHAKISKISSDTKYVPTTCIKLAVGCGIVAFAHESGTFSVGFIDPPIHGGFDALTAKDIHHKAITCLEWSNDGLILYAGDSEGNVSMSVVKISEGILQTAMIFKEDSSIIQLSYTNDALLVSSTKRTLIWLFQSETKVQVGEKERKSTGSFGCCFIPESLQGPSKKLYAARPGQRIWTADASGKVSSTAVFKPLLGDNPQTIYTLSGNDSKMNSGGQFAMLLIYYKKFVVSWDQSHLWVLDLDNGAIIGCHSNLGKIRGVSVSGHELFVLLNQRERFVQRFTLVNENLGPSCLDAVFAICDQDMNKPLSIAVEKLPETGVESVLPMLEPHAQGKTDMNKESVVPADNVFQRINAIPLDCQKGADIVFTAAKKKKKKKKVKQVSDETKTVAENQDVSDLKTNSISSTSDSIDETTVDDTSNAGAPSLSGVLLEDSRTEPAKKTTLECTITKIDDIDVSPTLPCDDDVKPKCLIPDEGTIKNQQMVENVPSTSDKEIHSSKQSAILPRDGEDEPHMVEVLDEEVTISNQKMENTPPNNEDIQTLQDFNMSTQVSNEMDLKDALPSLESDTHCKEVNEVIVDEGYQDVSVEPPVSPIQDKPDLELQDKPDLELQDKPDLEFPPLNDSGVQEIAAPMSSGPDSMESGDEIRILEETSNYLRSDIYDIKSSESPDKVSEKTQFEDKQNEDLHAPLFADTWSKRAMPTAQVIESLAISEKHVFCVNARGEVYYSDPGTASCHGWEQVNWKAKQIYVDGSCNLISYRGEGDKAFIRANVGSIHPVGNKSLQIEEDVASLASCSECSWVVTSTGGLRKANTSTLLELKGDLRNARIWRQEESFEKLCQIACYHDVLWGRTLDEKLCVYTGRAGGKKPSWIKVEEKKAKWINMSDDGTIWIITPDDEIWFKPGVSTATPTGEVWYQVTLGQYIIDDASVLGSAFNFFYSVGSAYRNSRTTEYLRHAAKGLIQSTKDMACSLFSDGGNPKQIYCNAQSGVWLLDTKNALHACRGQVTGAYWKRTCPSGTAQSATWRQVSTGLGSFIWALQPNGELTCFNPNGPSYNVVGPSSKKSLDFITSSPHGVWCFASENPDTIYIRDGISESYPQGFAWISLPLAHHDITGVRHISVGRITVWAVDAIGNVWVRIGSVWGDDSTVVSQAWVPIDVPAHAEMNRIEVNAKDTMVWATDTKGNVYARNGVSDDFLIGNSWREVSGITLKSVCLSSCVVYGLCTNGEIVCRFGVSATNCIGDYWKKIPGNFVQMSINDAGELWGITHEEWLFARKTKCLFGKMAAKEGPVGTEDVVGDEKKNLVDHVDGGDGDEGEEGEEEDGDWEML